MRNFVLNYFNFTTQMCICTIFFLFYFLLKAHRGLTKYPDFAVGWVNIHNIFLTMPREHNQRRVMNYYAHTVAA